MDKMRMESVDMTAQNIEKIGALFPNCITETVDENGKAKKAINFVYPDDYTMDKDKYEEGIDLKDEEGAKLVDETMTVILVSILICVR